MAVSVVLCVIQSAKMQEYRRKVRPKERLKCRLKTWSFLHQCGLYLCRFLYFFTWDETEMPSTFKFFRSINIYINNLHVHG